MGVSILFSPVWVREVVAERESQRSITIIFLWCREPSVEYGDGLCSERDRRMMVQAAASGDLGYPHV